MRRGQIGAFGAYLVLASSGWLLDSAFPSSIPALEMFGIELFLLCLVAVFWRGVGASTFVSAPLPWGPALLSGVLLFGLPSAILSMRDVAFPAVTRAVLLTLAPVILLLISAARAPGEARFFPHLAGALAGVGGCLLLLPISPQSLIGRPAVLVIAIALLGSQAVGSSIVRAATAGLPRRTAVLLLLGPTLVLILVEMAVLRPGYVVPAPPDLALMGWEIVEIALLVYLLRAVPAVPLASRFLLVPLLTTAEGFLFVRPAFSLRMAAGVGLVAFGAARLLRTDDEGRDSLPSLL